MMKTLNLGLFTPIQFIWTGFFIGKVSIFIKMNHQKQRSFVSYHREKGGFFIFKINTYLVYFEGHKGK